MNNRVFILELLENYKAFDEAEERSCEDMIAFVQDNEKCFENNFHLGHITGSALVVDRDFKSTLLTHHTVLNRWLQFGGHSDGHWNPLEVAWREAEEESGLTSLAYFPGHEGIFDIDIHPIPERGDMPEHKHYDVRILLSADKDEQFVVSDESHDLRWFTLDEACTQNTEEAFKRMVEKVKLV